MTDYESSLMQYVKLRLHNWAEWYSRGNLYGLGYPSRSIEHNIIYNAIVNKQPGQNKIYSNSEAEEIEQFVLEIHHQSKLMAYALRIFYFNQGSLRDKAKEMKLSHVYFKRYVDLAHQWIAGRLSCNDRFRD